MIPNPEHAILNLVQLKAGTSIRINGYTITPHKVSHPVPAVGYLVEDKKGKRFYTGDTGPSPDTWKKIGSARIHCLIIDVSFPNNMRALAISTGHLTPNLLKEELLKIHPEPEHIYIEYPLGSCLEI